jgi:hypothetical protein
MVKIWGYEGSDCEHCCLLGCDIVQFNSYLGLLMFRINLLAFSYCEEGSIRCPGKFMNVCQISFRHMHALSDQNTERPAPLLESRETTPLTTKAEVSQKRTRNFPTGEIPVELIVKLLRAPTSIQYSTELSSEQWVNQRWAQNKRTAAYSWAVQRICLLFDFIPKS